MPVCYRPMAAMRMDIDEQREKILCADGHLLITGGPGSGKTTIALMKAERLFDSLKPEQRILFLSFSRAAVRQITDRMGTHLPAAVRSVLEIRTFHAFFAETVRSHGRQLTGRQPAIITPDRARILEADHDGDWSTEARRLAAEEGRFVFDELAPAAARLLETSRSLRELYCDRYPIVIVDEFQDTNVDQWRTVKALASCSTVICLADPDQRIFGHLPGVDEHRIAHAVDALTPTQFDLSGDNFRSAGSGILDYANAVLRKLPARRPENVSLVLYEPYDPQAMKTTAHKIVIALRDVLAREHGKVPTIALLAKTNYLVAQISDQLSTDTLTVEGVFPAVDHEVAWDKELTAAGARVVASIMEWTALPRDVAVCKTLAAVADFYRVKVSEGTRTARTKITTIENAIAAVRAGRRIASKAAALLADAYDSGVPMTGNPVDDWRKARAILRGAAELDEVHQHARILRLFNATDTLAWALADTWNGSDSYTEAALAVRAVLAEEAISSSRPEEAPVSLMSMHRSKGKEFDGVIVVEGKFQGKLLDSEWDDDREMAERRVIRVALTRARHRVVLIRPGGAIALTPLALS